MSNLWKSLVIISLAMNLILAVRVWKLSPSSTVPVASSDENREDRSGGPSAAATSTNDSASPPPLGMPQPTMPGPTVQVRDDDGELAQKVRRDLFKEISSSIEPRFPGMAPEKLDLRDGKFVVLMKKPTGDRMQRESIRNNVSSILQVFAERHDELKGRDPVVRFPDDPPPRGQGL